MTRYVTIDGQGAVRVGPFGAWWAWLLPADHGDIPAVRLRAWNVAAVAFAAVAFAAAHRVGVLGWVLGALAGMVAATGIVVVPIARRYDPGCGSRCAERVAVAWAARRAQYATPPVCESGDVAA